MARSLEQVLADAEGELPVLRKHGSSAIADAIERLCAEVRQAAEDYMVWLSESDAVLASDHSAAWFRARFAGWQRQGLARWNPRNQRERQYRALIVPRRHDADAVRADAEHAALHGEPVG